MDKIYLLLRDNLQTGPFTIGELWLQQLRPSDMIWIEGKSTAWAHLSEMELNPSMAPDLTESQTTGSPVDEIERKAEALRQRALSFRPQAYQPAVNRLNENHHVASVVREEDAIDFIDHRTEKKNAVGLELLLTFAVVGLFALGIYKGRSLFNQKKEASASVATQLVSGDQNAAKAIIPSVTYSPAAESLITSPDTTSTAIVKPRVKGFIKKSGIQNSVDTSSIKLDVPVSVPLKNEEEIRVSPPVKIPASIPAKEIVTQKEKTAPTSVNQPEEKKKTLGEAFKSIFKKKKKNDGSKTEKDD